VDVRGWRVGVGRKTRSGSECGVKEVKNVIRLKAKIKMPRVC
jgi:hypothetical protein